MPNPILSTNTINLDDYESGKFFAIYWGKGKICLNFFADKNHKPSATLKNNYLYKIDYSYHKMGSIWFDFSLPRPYELVETQKKLVCDILIEQGWQSNNGDKSALYDSSGHKTGSYAKAPIMKK